MTWCKLAMIGVLALSASMWPTGTVVAAEEFPIPLEAASSLGAITGAPDGSIWFTENGEGWVGRIAPSGLITGEFPIPNAVQPPSSELYYLAEYSRLLQGIALDSNGNAWFTDHGIEDLGYTQGFIGEATPSGGITEFPITAAQTPVHHPNRIASGSDGNMWFTDEVSTGQGGTSLDSIGRITPSGEIKEFPLTSSYHSPGGIALGLEGDMWFVNEESTGQGQIQAIGRITPSGTITEFPLAAAHSFPGAVMFPIGIVLGPGGDMWFAEYNVNKIGRITPIGEVSEFAVPSASGQIAFGSDGNIWFTEGSGSNAFGRITPAGETTTFAPILTDGGMAHDVWAGAGGDIWFTDYGVSVLDEGIQVSHIGRFVIPMIPANMTMPTISGEAVEGKALAVSTGSWSNDPSSFTYQWQTCDAVGERCTDLKGETGSAHALAAGDVAHTLRAVVSAVNLGGSASVVSAASAVVGVPPPPMVALIKSRTPEVGATMTWSFGWSRTYTIVEGLVLHGLPAGYGWSVEVGCHGEGCAFRHKHLTVRKERFCHRRRCATEIPSPSRGNLNLSKLFRGRHLRPGTHISVSVVNPGWIGKFFVFTVRDDRAPHVQIACLAPGSTTHVSRC